MRMPKVLIGLWLAAAAAAPEERGASAQLDDLDAVPAEALGAPRPPPEEDDQEDALDPPRPHPRLSREKVMAIERQAVEKRASASSQVMKQFMHNFARNMRFSILSDSKGDMPEAERQEMLRQLREGGAAAPDEDPAGAEEARPPRALQDDPAQPQVARPPRARRHAHRSAGALGQPNRRRPGRAQEAEAVGMLNAHGRSRPQAVGMPPDEAVGVLNARSPDEEKRRRQPPDEAVGMLNARSPEEAAGVLNARGRSRGADRASGEDVVPKWRGGRPRHAGGRVEHERHFESLMERLDACKTKECVHALWDEASHGQPRPGRAVHAAAAAEAEEDDEASPGPPPPGRAVRAAAAGAAEEEDADDEDGRAARAAAAEPRAPPDAVARKPAPALRSESPPLLLFGGKPAEKPKSLREEDAPSALHAGLVGAAIGAVVALAAFLLASWLGP